MPHRNSMSFRFGRRVAVLGLALLIFLSGRATPGEPDGSKPSSASIIQHALTVEDLATFLDGVVPLQLRREDIAGAVISVVKDGKVLFARGYGYADVAARKPVSADGTLFRVASISKLFACTSVMQLVERGELALDADINQYLDFRIPETFPQPITLRNLMTHTAGFQETIRGNRIPDGGRLLPLKEFLPANLPPRIYPPGTTPAYSNYGNTLAGHIVERVSGQSFEDYVDEHIFRPLGMQHSTYTQPLPEPLKPMMSNGYLNGSDPPDPFEVVQTFPGGGLSATAEDMARFMIAHLQEGRLGKERILTAETARLMHSRQLELVPSMNGSAIGFAEQARNGYRVIGHGGDLRAFHSQLFLVPELGLGFFISQNSRGREGPGNLRTLVWRSFFDRYFPRVAPLNDPPANPSSDPREFSGFYKGTRCFDFSIFKLWSLMGQVTVTAKADGTITSSLIGEYGQHKPLRETEPMVYCEEKGQDCIAFRRDEAGYLQLVADFPHVVFQRVPWYEKRPLNLTVVVASATIFGLTLVLWPLGALIRRHYGRRLHLTRERRRLRLIVMIVCALDLAFIVAGRELFQKLPDISIEPWVHLIQIIGIVGAAGGLVAIYHAARCLTDRRGWLLTKLHAIAVAVACLGLLGFSLIWNLFDFSLR
jgi:CubicO group peptidase (beta-lactamase class C family)